LYLESAHQQTLFCGGARKRKRRLLPILEITMRESELRNVAATLHCNWDRRVRQAGVETMVGELMLAIGVFAVVIVGVLIMIQAITFEHLFNAIGRFLLFVGLALATVYAMRMLFCSFVVPWLVSLKAFFLWLAIGVLAVILVGLLVRATISRFQH
jgi:hypothetical protein